MKKLLLIFILLFSTLMFSTPSYSEWTGVSKNVSGTNYYVDFERIRKHGGYVYWWDLVDKLKPDKNGDLSGKYYNQGDCKLFRYKNLSAFFYKGPMGKGTSENVEITGKHKDWQYFVPNSSGETILKSVCGQ